MENNIPNDKIGHAHVSVPVHAASAEYADNVDAVVLDLHDSAGRRPVSVHLAPDAAAGLGLRLAAAARAGGHVGPTPAGGERLAQSAVADAYDRGRSEGIDDARRWQLSGLDPESWPAE